MKRTILIKVCLTFLTIGLSSMTYLYGQNEINKLTDFSKIRKNSGKVYFGEILADNGKVIEVNTFKVGILVIPKSEIRSIRNLTQLEVKRAKGEIRENTPFANQYQLSQNALPYRKGQHYASLNLHGPEFNFALSDRFSIGAMNSWIASPIGVSFRYNIPTKNEELNFGFGTILMSSTYLYGGKGIGGLHFGNVTLGNKIRNFNITVGLGYLNDGFSQRTVYEVGLQRFRPGSYLSLAGTLPIGKSASFFFDSMVAFSEQRNYTFLYVLDPIPSQDVTIYSSGTRSTVLLMPGIRFHRSEKFAFQFGVAGLLEYSTNGYEYFNSSKKDRFIPLPMMSWLIKL